MADFNINVKLNGAEQTISTVGELEAALKATKQELKGVGLESQQFDELTTQARKLQREMQNVKESVNFDKNIADITESVGRLTGTITAGFAAATSAMQLFGGDSKDLTEQQVKAQQALTLALSATTIAANAAKLTEDARNVGMVLQRGLIAAITSLTSAQAAATGSATIAQRALNAAMAANPIGILITAVAALVGLIYALGDSENDAAKTQENLNKLMEQNAEITSKSIARKRELLVLQAEIESAGKSETERLKIQQNLQSQLFNLDIEAIQNRKDFVEQSIKDNEKLLDDYKLTYNQISQYVIKPATEQSKEEKKVYEAYNARLINEREFYSQLLDIKVKYNTDASEEDQKALTDQVAKFKGLLAEQEDLNTQLDILDAEKTKKEAEENAKRAEDYKKNLKVKKDAEDDFQKSVDQFNKKQSDAIKQQKRENEDATIERISLNSKGEEDLIKAFDETDKKLKISRERALEDTKDKYKEDIKAFEEAARKKLDANGKRIISEQQIAEAEKQFQVKLNEELLSISAGFNEQIVANSNAKRAKLTEIDQVLQKELAYGDNSTADNRRKLRADDIAAELAHLDKIISISRTGVIKLMTEKEAKQKELRKASYDAEISELTTQAEIKKTQVVGDEAQKQKQILAIEERKNEEIRIAYQKLQDDLAVIDQQANQARLQRALEVGQEIVNVTQGVVSQISTLNNEYGQLERDRQAGELNDYYDQQNAELASLKTKLDKGEITKKQYEDKVRAIEDAAAKKKAAVEDQYAKKAFERQKALAIVGAILNTASGVMQALGNLPPPASYIMAAITGALGIAQIALIAKQQYRSQADSTSSLNIPSAETGNAGSDNSAAPVIQAASTGGFTSFASGLVNNPTGGQTSNGSSTSGDGQRVYVVESDITNSQRRVSVAEQSATF